MYGKDQLQNAQAVAGEGAVLLGRCEAEERRVSIRPLGSQAQIGLGLEEALALLAVEATAPDGRRERGWAGEVRVAAE